MIKITGNGGIDPSDFPFVHNICVREFEEFSKALIRRAIDYDALSVFVQFLDRDSLQITEDVLELPCQFEVSQTPVDSRGVYARGEKDVFIPLRPAVTETEILGRFGKPCTYALEWCYRKHDADATIVGKLRVNVEDGGWLEVAKDRIETTNATLLWKGEHVPLVRSFASDGFIWAFSIPVCDDEIISTLTFDFYGLPFQKAGLDMMSLTEPFSLFASSLTVVRGEMRVDCLALDEIDGDSVVLELKFRDTRAHLPSILGQELWPGVECDALCKQIKATPNTWEVRTQTAPSGLEKLELPFRATPQWLTREGPPLDVVPSRAIPLLWTVTEIGTIPNALFLAVAKNGMKNDPAISDPPPPLATTPHVRLAINPLTGELDEFIRSESGRSRVIPANEVSKEFHVLGAVRDKVRWSVEIPTDLASSPSAIRNWMTKAEQPVLLVPRRKQHTEAWGGVWCQADGDAHAANLLVHDWEQTGRTLTLKTSTTAQRIVLHVRGLLLGMRKAHHDRVTVWTIDKGGIPLHGLTELHKALMPFDIDLAIGPLQYTVLRSRARLQLPNVQQEGNNYTLSVKARLRAFADSKCSVDKLANISSRTHESEAFTLENSRREVMWFAVADPTDENCGVLLSYAPIDKTWRFIGVIAFEGTSALVTRDKGMAFRIGTGVGRFEVQYEKDKITSRSFNCPAMFVNADDSLLSAFCSAATVPDFPGFRRIGSSVSNTGNSGTLVFVSVEAPVPEFGFHVWENPNNADDPPPPVQA